MDDEASVEQRCARIRGRMVWILSQLEGDGIALADMADLKSLAAVAPGSRGVQLELERPRRGESTVEYKFPRATPMPALMSVPPGMSAELMAAIRGESLAALLWRGERPEAPFTKQMPF